MAQAKLINKKWHQWGKDWRTAFIIGYTDYARNVDHDWSVFYDLFNTNEQLAYEQGRLAAAGMEGIGMNPPMWNGGNTKVPTKVQAAWDAARDQLGGLLPSSYE